MKTSLSILIIMIFCISANGQSVGINIINPDPSAALEVHSFDQGILVPRLKTNAIMGIQNPAIGLLVYDANKDRFFQYNGTDWVGISTTDAFENFFGLVRNGGNVYQDDFLFGAMQLPPNGQMISDTSFFFDKSKGAFRMGRVTNSDRSSETNLGTWSVAGGSNNLVSGSNSTAFGSENLVSGNFASALGTSNESSGEYSFSAGAINKASNIASVAFGITSEANGYSSVAAGSGVIAGSFASTALGQFNEGNGNSSSWIVTDPIFEIGIGTHYINDRKNAVTVLKNGKTGIGTSSPDTTLSVVGVARAAFDESETDYIEMSHGGSNAFINAVGAGNLDIRHGGTNVMTITPGGRVGIRTNSPDTDFSVIGKVRAAIQNNENEYTEIFHGGDNGYINTVGDGNLQFRHDNNTVMSLNDGGDLFVDGQLTLGNANTHTDYTFPSVDGNADQYLKTDGNGILSWRSIIQSPFATIGQNIVPIITTHNFFIGGGTVPQMNSTAKMIYYNNDQNALRHGYINQSDDWDISNLGLGSFATGYNVMASGNYSASFGDRTEASGEDAFAAGENTDATGYRSASFGNFTTASGESSFAIGRTGNAAGVNSFKSGFNTIANGDNSATFGVGNTAHGYASLVAGDGNIVNARSSMALGAGLETNSYGCFAIGAFNEGFGSNPDIWVGSNNESIFEVGIGDALNRKNAMTITKKGTVAIGASPNNIKLSVNANGSESLLWLGRNNDSFLTIGNSDSVQIYKQLVIHDRIDLWPQVDRLVQYRVELPNIATLEDGTAVAYNWDTYSDQRVKKNIEEIPYGLDAVLALNPVKYNHHSTDYEDGFKLRDDYSEEIGFIAQETYEVIKEIVNKPEDESKALWTMNYEKLTPVLVKAIQEQQAIIESLQKQLSDKESEMKSLRSDVEKLFNMLKDNN